MSQDFLLSPDDAAEIVAILDATSYSVINISTGRFTLRVAREGEGWTQEWDWGDKGSSPQAVHEGGEQSPQVGVEEGAVTAAIPGTFYRAPQPGAPPFVEVGSSVTAESVIGIVETMKLMNPVHAGLAGVIEEIVVEDASSVDAGAVLMRIRGIET